MASTTEASESPLLAANESCATLADAPLGFPSNCRAYRSCRSCLQKSGCAISASSRCVSQSDLTYIKSNATTNYHNAFALSLSLPNTTVSNATSQSWQFPAIETTYCPADDAVCSQCKEASFYRPGTIADSRFCVGSGGCVCVFNCEVVDPSASLAECPIPPPVATSPSPDGGTWLEGKSDLHGAVIYFLVIPIAVLLAASLWCLLQAQYREQARPVLRPPPQRPVGSSPKQVEEVTLEVSGWKQQREQRILSEYRQAASNGPVQPAAFQQLRSPSNRDHYRDHYRAIREFL